MREGGRVRVRGERERGSKAGALGVRVREGGRSTKEGKAEEKKNEVNFLAPRVSKLHSPLFFMLSPSRAVSRARLSLLSDLIFARF